jgi:hypothetical protein
LIWKIVRVKLSIVPEDLFDQLIKECAIALKEANKITYSEQKIAKLARI